MCVQHAVLLVFVRDRCRGARKEKYYTYIYIPRDHVSLPHTRLPRKKIFSDFDFGTLQQNFDFTLFREEKKTLLSFR